MRRTGIGEVLPACTDVVPGLLPQPAIFRIFTVICNGLPPGVTVSIKPCRNPMIFTSPGGIVMAVELSMIGKAAMDRLVEASCPENGPLWAVICIGQLGARVISCEIWLVTTPPLASVIILLVPSWFAISRGLMFFSVTGM